MTACTPIDENRTLTTHVMWWSMRWLTLLGLPPCHSSDRFYRDQAVFVKQARDFAGSPPCVSPAGLINRQSGISELRTSGSGLQKRANHLKTAFRSNSAVAHMTSGFS